ncbi:MAG: DUF120 domain-containing protein [Candidatus Diapherotrites archaeon]
MKENNLPLLLLLAKRAGIFESSVLSTAEIASALSLSQQSASRKLRDLEKEGLIERSATPQGTKVRLTLEGRNELKKMRNDLNDLFSKKRGKKLVGKVESGIGEGRYYVSMPGYMKQFTEKIGIKIYPGTLNLKIDEIKLKKFIEGENSIKLEPFSTSVRSFGGIEAFPVRINKTVKGAMIFPERTTHPSDIAEIIAPYYLRKKLSLKDGSKVELSFG